MTAIKQVAVTTPKHFSNLAAYLEDERALAHGSQNLMDEKNWQREMERTREAYGHDVPSRIGAKNTVAFHQVLAFNPDECSCNGGPMTPERCMEYAQQWVFTRYGSHEARWCLHEEACKTDGTKRYAVHIAINRTDLETGKRLNEGRAKEAKVARANAVRDLDRAYGLRQMKANERNSRVHAIQPTKAEREMQSRGVQPAKAYIRQHVAQRVQQIAAEQPQGNRMRELAHRLKEDGVEMTTSKDGRQLQFAHAGYRVNGNRLGRGYSMAGIAKGLGIEAGILMVRAMEDDRER